MKHIMMRYSKQSETVQVMNEMCENCKGYETSDCCGAYTDPDILICMDCKEHCGTQCEDCENKTIEDSK